MSDADELPLPRKRTTPRKPNRPVLGENAAKKKKSKQPERANDAASGQLLLWLVSAGVALCAIALIVGVIWLRPRAVPQEQAAGAQPNNPKAAPQPLPKAVQQAMAKVLQQNGQKAPDGGTITIHIAKFRGMKGVSPEGEIVVSGKPETFTLNVPRAEWARWAAMPPGFEFPVREMLVGTLYTKESRRSADGQPFEVNVDAETYQVNPGAPMHQGNLITDGSRGPSGRAHLKVFVPSGRGITSQLPAAGLPLANPDWQRAIVALELLDKGAGLDAVDERILRLVCAPHRADLAKDAGLPEALHSVFGVTPDLRKLPPEVPPETAARRRLAAAARLRHLPQVTPNDYLPAIILTLSAEQSDKKTADVVADGLGGFPGEVVVKVVGELLTDPQNRPALVRLLAAWSVREQKLANSTALPMVLQFDAAEPVAAALRQERDVWSHAGLAASGGARWMTAKELLAIGQTREIDVRVAVLRALKYLPPEQLTDEVIKYATNQLFQSDRDSSIPTRLHVAFLESFREIAPRLHPLPNQIATLATRGEPEGPLAAQVMAASMPAARKQLDELGLAYYVHSLYETRARCETAVAKATLDAGIDSLDPNGAKTAARFLDFATGAGISERDAKNYQYYLVAINPVWVGQVVERCRTKLDDKTLEAITAVLTYLFANQDAGMTMRYWDDAALAKAADVVVAAAGEDHEPLAINMQLVAAGLNRGPTERIVEAGLQHANPNVRVHAGRAAGKRYSPDYPALLKKALLTDDPVVIEGALAAIAPNTAQTFKDRLLPILKEAAATAKQSKAKKQLDDAIKFLGA